MKFKIDELNDRKLNQKTKEFHFVNKHYFSAFPFQPPNFFAKTVDFTTADNIFRFQSVFLSTRKSSQERKERESNKNI